MIIIIIIITKKKTSRFVSGKLATNGDATSDDVRSK